MDLSPTVGRSLIAGHPEIQEFHSYVSTKKITRLSFLRRLVSEPLSINMGMVKSGTYPCFLRGSGEKNPAAMQQMPIPCLDRKDTLEGKMAPTPVFFPGKSQGQTSLSLEKVYSPWGFKRGGYIKQISLHTTLCPSKNILYQMSYQRRQKLIFTPQGTDQGLLHSRQILYYLRHKGTAGILE